LIPLINSRAMDRIEARWIMAMSICSSSNKLRALCLEDAWKMLGWVLRLSR